MKIGFAILICDRCDAIINKEPLVYKVKKAYKHPLGTKRRELVDKTLCVNCYNEVFNIGGE